MPSLPYLHILSAPAIRTSMWAAPLDLGTHLLEIDAVVIGPQCHVFLAGNVEAAHLDLFRFRGILEGTDNCLHLLRAELEAWRGCPDTVACGAEDGGFVDMAGANQAAEILDGGAQHRVWIIPLIDVF
jgi:hypothetical protein